VFSEGLARGTKIYGYYKVLSPCIVRKRRMPRSVAAANPPAGGSSDDPNSDIVGGSGLRFAAHAAGPSPSSGSETPQARYANVRIKGQGLADELYATNETIRKTIKSMSAGMHPTLEVCTYCSCRTLYTQRLRSDWLCSCGQLNLRSMLLRPSNSTAT